MMNISRSALLASGLTVIVVIWMLTGLLRSSDSPVSTSEQAEQGSRSLMSVSVRESSAQPVTRKISISAHTEPNRYVEVAAETDGRIVSIGAPRGTQVESNQLLATIDIRDRNARLRQAEALVKQRELEYQAADRLRGRELLSESQIAETRSQLESARAALENIKLEVTHTAIIAPFDGMIEERMVELGDFVGIGDPVATIVDIDPLIVVGDINEREIFQLGIGSTGEARMLNGEMVSGTVRYIAPVASSNTRTFRIELAVDNPDYQLRAGMSSEISLPTGEIYVHKMTPALLTLDDNGNVGVKTVNKDNRVQFYPVEIALSDSDSIWVTGLPERVSVITVGQGFVVDGQVVNPLFAEAAIQINEDTEE